jgi:hypothetical protein
MVPRLAILGYGRAGKDTMGIYLGMHTEHVYVGSTSDVVNPMIAKELGLSPEENWRRRHEGNNRQFWYNWCNEYRKHDPSRLAQAVFNAGGSMVVGLRDKIELAACRDKQLFDLIVWIENPRVPADSTVTFTRDDCDIVITNESDLPRFFSKIAKFCDTAGIRTDCHFQDPSHGTDICRDRWFSQVVEPAAQEAGVVPHVWLEQALKGYAGHLRLLPYPGMLAASSLRPASKGTTFQLSV